MEKNRYMLCTTHTGALYVGVREDGLQGSNHVEISSYRTIDEAFDARDELQSRIDTLNKCTTCEN